MRDPIYTVGHSILAADAFLALLQGHGVRQLADIRLIPKSARHPHFAGERLAPLLESNGISYRHFRDLGGRRTPRPDSVNTAWRVDAFRGYADYMQTAPFRRALDQLSDFASTARTTVMCAEAMWWQCHRRLLADALLVRGVPVLHILSAAAPKAHELSEFARAGEGEVIYPGLL
jgi:uncharacterized protein (DUF488 family)